MALVYLLMGSNLGDREKLLKAAKDKIANQVGDIDQESAIYETEPWGFDDDRFFLNQLLRVSTEMSAELVLKEVLQIEIDLGRQRHGQQMSIPIPPAPMIIGGYPSGRTMDIDILLYDDLVVEGKQLTIPHPRLHLRQFALVPLNEIAENVIHPAIGKSMKQLLLACEDSQQVTLFVN